MTQWLHPGRLTWNLQIIHLERKMIFQTFIIMFHVNLPGCSHRLIQMDVCTTFTESLGNPGRRRRCRWRHCLRQPRPPSIKKIGFRRFCAPWNFARQKGRCGIKDYVIHVWIFFLVLTNLFILPVVLKRSVQSSEEQGCWVWNWIYMYKYTV